MPAGVINTKEDSEDDVACTGEQKEIQRECQELRAVDSWKTKRVRHCCGGSRYLSEDWKDN